MEKKHELTEHLKLVENQIYAVTIDLKGIVAKLDTAYLYEEELIQRLNNARVKTNELQNEFFKGSSEIVRLHGKMKDIFDIFTANFSRH